MRLRGLVALLFTAAYEFPLSNMPLTWCYELRFDAGTCEGCLKRPHCPNSCHERRDLLQLGSLRVFLATDSMRQLFVQSCGTGAVPFLALKERNRFTRDSSEKS